MIALDLPQLFIDDIELILSGADLSLLRQMTILLDRLSYRQELAFDGDRNTSSHTAGDYRVWWGSLMYRDGMDDLVVKTYSASYGSANLKTYINGVEKATVAASSASTATIDISSGYTDGQILEIAVYTSGNATKTSTHWVTDIYATPVVVSSSWPTLLTFNGIYNSGRLNLLRDALQYLFDRVNAVPLGAQIGYVHSPSSHKVQSAILYNGSVARNVAGEVLKIVGSNTIFNTAEHYTVEINGATVYTSPTYTLGTTNNLTPAGIDLSAYTLGARQRMAIIAHITNASNQPAQGGGTNSRYSFSVIRSQADASGYAVATPPTDFAAAAAITDPTLDGRLNALVTMLNNIKARLDARPELWNRVRAVRRRPAHDDHENTKLARQYPHVITRRGDRLVIRGKGVSIGWGGITLKTKEGALDYDDYTFAHEQQAVSGEKYETQTIYLDSLPALYPGTPYYLFGGDIVYCSEYLI